MKRLLKEMTAISVLLTIAAEFSYPLSVSAENSLDLYRPVLNQFYDNISSCWEGFDSDSDFFVYGVSSSEMALDYYSYIWKRYEADCGLDNAGYALTDLNADGCDELLIGITEGGYSTLMEIYTIYQNHIVHLASSGERDRFYIGNDNEIIESGSGSAMTTYNDYYSVSDGKLFCYEAAYADGETDMDNPFFYGTELGYAGTYDSNDMEHISSETYDEIVASHSEKTIEYTPFSRYNKTQLPIHSESLSHSGSCGKNVEWEIKSDATLVITGYGEMYDYETYGYDDNYAPWLDIESIDVKQIIIGDGVQTIGECSFTGLPVISVQLPESLQEIRNGAFHNCLKLKSLTIPEGVTTIANDSIATCGNGGDGVVEGFTLYGYRGSTAEEYAKNLNNTPGMDHKITFHTLDEEETFNIELSGNCGTSSHWTFDPNTGTLTISGTGDVTESGWNDGAVTRDEDGHTNLRRIVIEEGITRLMQESGMFGAELEEIQLPSTLTEIGDWYFSQGNDATDSCALHEIIIPASVTHIGDYAFCCNYSGDGTITTYYDDFVMKGYTGTEAESYAESNGIQFVALDSPDTEQPDSGQLETSPEIQTEQTVTEKKDSTISSRTIATICLVAAGVLLVIAGVYLWIKKR